MWTGFLCEFFKVVLNILCADSSQTFLQELLFFP